MEIMNIVIKRIESSGQEEDGNNHMVKQLLEKGFSLNDIDVAMGLVAMITSKIDPIVKVSKRETGQDGRFIGIRQLSAYEALRLTPDAQKYLLQSLEQGHISTLQFEKTLLYLQKMDLRGVNKTKLEIILLMNKPIDDIQLDNNGLNDGFLHHTIH
jgi:hypothetical protein